MLSPSSKADPLQSTLALCRTLWRVNLLRLAKLELVPRSYPCQPLELSSASLIFLSSCCASVAQNTTTSNIQVPRTTAQSGLEWTETANPNHYFDAIGQKGAVLGRQDGRFEAWVWPIKVLHGFRLEFQLDNMPEAVSGEHYLQSVEIRPESATLLYVHPNFTVKQIIWAADDRAAIVQFFDVESDRPLTITAKFVPDFKPMWPAAMGGQHSTWLADLKAFAFSDGTYTPTALLGSPAATASTQFMDHSLVGGEMLLQIATNPSEARRGYYPLVIALAMDGEKNARAAYQDVLDHAREMYDSKAQHWHEFLANTLAIQTPDAEFNRAFTWAKVSIEQGWSCTAPPSAATETTPHPSVPPEGFAFPGDEKCGLVAGYGPAGDGERPGFAWWFGGDGLMSTWAMLDYGDTAGALRELRFLRSHQRSDGKMMHEMVQSTGIVDWWKNYHFAYMHADTTADVSVRRLESTGGRPATTAFLADFWPSIQKAYAYCVVHARQRRPRRQHQVRPRSDRSWLAARKGHERHLCAGLLDRRAACLRRTCRCSWRLRSRNTMQSSGWRRRLPRYVPSGAMRAEPTPSA